MEFDRGNSLSSSPSNTEELERDRLPNVNDLIKSSNRSYKLIAILGEGGYGKVFRAVQNNKLFALKAEKYTNSVLHVEITVLKAALKSGAKHICELYDYGAVKPDFVFMVVTLLGKDLYKLRNEQSGRHFSVSTSVRIGLQTCNAIEELHRCGYLSRDIKPGNYAVGLAHYKQEKMFFLFDFGLARKYLDKACHLIQLNCSFFIIFFYYQHGKHHKSRGEIGWRGTTRYGSLKAHEKLDLSRRDDLESWFYCLVEVTCGVLPWRHISDRSIAHRGKLQARNEKRKQFLENCPEQYDAILILIDKIEFDQAPPYGDIYKLLNEVCEERNIAMDENYDWEVDEHTMTNNDEVKSGSRTEGSDDSKNDGTNLPSDLPT